MEDRLIAECRILVDHEVLKRETRQREKCERKIVKMDGAANGSADVARYAPLQPVYVDQRWNERHQQKDQNEHKHAGETAAKPVSGVDLRDGLGAGLSFVGHGTTAHSSLCGTAIGLAASRAEIHHLHICKAGPPLLYRTTWKVRFQRVWSKICSSTWP